MIEQRAASRRRRLRAAQIRFNDGASVIDCTLRDISRSGARLQLPSTLDIPEEFELVTSETGVGARTARVVWRKLNEMGVAFE
jgi:hypothetical protein